ncbi:MAG: 3-dehydroquinate synthase family protein [Planctomycetota bacterium]
MPDYTMPDEAPQHPPATSVPVHLAPRPANLYHVQIGDGVLRALADLTKPYDAVLLVQDPGVPGALADEAATIISEAGPRLARHTFAEPRETVKNLDSVQAITRDLADLGADRSTSMVVALGGGIVGDTAGFAAAAYQRAIPVIQCPTTLLAMVDASVGGKTGVNLQTADGSLLKNYLGAFHQPLAVLADARALASLDPRVFRAGLAECVKHACLSAAFNDPDLLAWTEDNAQAIVARDHNTLGELIHRNVRVKAAVVAEDEHERAHTAGRALLNLGHTFAHVIEPLAQLSPDNNPAHAPLHHGEAVALGLVAAAAAAHAIDPTPGTKAHAERLGALLTALQLPTVVADLPDSSALAAAMLHDKKTRAGRLRIVLPHPDATASTLNDPPESALLAGWDAIRLS